MSREREDEDVKCFIFVLTCYDKGERYGMNYL